MRHSLFYSSVFGFVGGIVIHSIHTVSITWIFFLGLISIALMLFAYNDDRVYEKRDVKQYSWFFLILIFLFCCSLGLARYHAFVQWKGDPTLATEVGKKVSLEGIVVEEPSPKETHTQLIVEVSAPLESTKIIVFDDTYSERKYGDNVHITGVLQKPENFAADNGRTFDYISYLQKDGIFYEIPFGKVTLISSHHGNSIKNFMLTIKQNFIASLNKVLPYSESRLAAGLVVAGKGALPKDILQEFTDTGTIQVVVLSGFNVTIIAEMMMLFLGSLPKLVGSIVGGFSIILFAIAAGGSATIIRAVIMVIIALVGKKLKRKYNVGRSLIISAIFMLMFNPMLLVFDPSFQLSFLATFGLIYYTPLVEPYLSFVSEKLNLRNTVASTTATQIFVTPFILFLTGKLSIVALPANLALFLLTPVTMLFSFLSGLLVSVLGNFFRLFITPLGFATFLLLRSMLLIVHIFSRIPFASVSIPSFPFWCVALSYCGFGVILFRFEKIKTELPQPSKTRVTPSCSQEGVGGVLFQEK